MVKRLLPFGAARWRFGHESKNRDLTSLKRMELLADSKDKAGKANVAIGVGRNQLGSGG
jgi:hypothetical protein